MPPAHRQPCNENAIVAGAGIGLFAATGRAWVEHDRATNALRRIRAAPCVPVSGLGSLLDDAPAPASKRGRLVAVHGQAICKLVFLTHSSSSKQHKLLDQIHEGPYENLGIGEGDSKVSVELIPLALVEGDHFVYVAADSARPLPLKKFLRQIHLVDTSSYPFISALRDQNSVVTLNEEIIVRTDIDITALGICREQNGAIEIESYRNLPYFMSDKTKNEIEADLSISTKNCYWAAILLGAFTTGIFGYAFSRRK